MVTLNRHLLQHYKQYRKKHKIRAADFSFYIVKWEILNLSCFTIDPNRVIVRAINLHKKGEKEALSCGADTNSAQKKLPTSHLTNQRRDDFEADNFQNLH